MKTSTKAPANVTLFWNNICILNRREVTLLDGIRERLLDKGIDLDIHQFGLGYPQHMSDNLREPNAPLPDILVSADLEVFEDSRVFNRLKDSLHPTTQWYPLKQDPWLAPLRRDEGLLPYLVIPIVLYTYRPELYAGKTLAEIIREELPLSFGGINNSAVKSVAKLVWGDLGEDAARALLERSTVHEIPLQAFKHVKTTREGAALVPTAYTLTADGENDFCICPADGAVGIPSYIAARTSISEQIARTVIDELVSPALCTYYVENGSLICPLEHAPVHPWVAANIQNIHLPNQDWLKTLDPEVFYRLYLASVPGSRL